MLDRRRLIAALLAAGTAPMLGAAREPSAVRAASVNPANGDASPATRALLAALRERQRHGAGRILTGQFCGYPNIRPDLLVQTHPWSTYRRAYMTDVERITGRTPAIMGVDYYGNSGAIDEGPGIATTEHSHLRTLNYDDRYGTGVHINQELIRWWRSGGLVTINVHMYRPDTHRDDGSGAMLKFGFGGTDPRYPADPRFKPYDLGRMLPGGEDRAKWVAMMDGMAAGLRELRDAGVVVLWRPFHEMDLGFWWGKHDPALFQRVWRDMFSYFSGTKALDNLVWVFTGSPAYDPGPRFADIVGTDQYQPVVTPSPICTGAERQGRLHALTEFGFGIDELRDNSVAFYDFAKLARSLRETMPRSSYVLVWSDAWRIGNPRHQNQRSLMNDPFFIAKEDLQRLGLRSRS